MNNKLLSIKVSLNSNEFLMYELGSSSMENDIAYNLSVAYINNDHSESVILEDISRDYEEAASRTYLFAKETVTPITAQIIMEELLSTVYPQKT